MDLFLCCAIVLCLVVISYQDSPLLESGITEDDAALIVKLHNQLRSSVAQGTVTNQPTASNMKEMKWDPQLAKLAQTWADKCNYGHNKPTDGDYLNVGQNIAQTMANYNISKNFTDAIYDWFNELFNPGYPPSGKSTENLNAMPLFYSDKTGHYTQIVWANSSFVGCGFVKYKLASGPYTQALYYVCNYGPAGNYIGMNVYRFGKPASDCPNNAPESNTYSGLCSNNS